MHRHFGICLATLALAACGGSGDRQAGDAPGKVSSAEIRQRMTGLAKPEPGLYRTSTKVIDVNIANAPAGIADGMKRSLGKEQTSEYCLTPDQAAKGYEEMMRHAQKGDCSFQRFDASGGKIDAAMTCETSEGAMAHMTVTGTGTSTSSDVDMQMRMDAPGFGAMTMRSHSHSERVGPCS